jgi:hypothetical protein
MGGVIALSKSGLAEPEESVIPGSESMTIYGERTTRPGNGRTIRAPESMGEMFEHTRGDLYTASSCSHGRIIAVLLASSIRIYSPQRALA